ncbi:MAG: hypothetical protein UR65_C0058G0002 [Candidatus Moranbacteria bacterium GW2011_GWE2_35_164]|nr:MAG: hypothetical protein UR65_C0058G0002 [Candidatus Moranbacteria bacterium GW2011_GWE2_35_164]
MEHESLKQYNNFYASTNNSNMSSRLNKFLYSEIYAWRDLKFFFQIFEYKDLFGPLRSSFSEASRNDGLPTGSKISNNFIKIKTTRTFHRSCFFVLSKSFSKLYYGLTSLHSLVTGQLSVQAAVSVSVVTSQLASVQSLVRLLVGPQDGLQADQFVQLGGQESA